jgi:hypothetical protein
LFCVLQTLVHNASSISCFENVGPIVAFFASIAIYISRSAHPTIQKFN